MKNKSTIIMWSMAIITYIFNIVVAIISEPLKITAIAGWIVCIILAFLIMVLDHAVSQREKTISDLIELYENIIEKQINLTENSDHTKISDNDTEQNKDKF